MVVAIVVADGGGDEEAVVFIEGDKVVFEGFVVSGGEAETVSGVHAGVDALGPADNVAGDAELGQFQTGDAAAVLVLVEDHLAEEALTVPGFGGAEDIAAFSAVGVEVGLIEQDFDGFRFGLQQPGGAFVSVKRGVVVDVPQLLFVGVDDQVLFVAFEGCRTESIPPIADGGFALKDPVLSQALLFQNECIELLHFDGRGYGPDAGCADKARGFSLEDIIQQLNRANVGRSPVAAADCALTDIV